MLPDRPRAYIEEALAKAGIRSVAARPRFRNLNIFGNVLRHSRRGGCASICG
jgi:hypothetical protein